MTTNAQRCRECPARTSKGTCQLVDRRLGWKHGMPMPICDSCLAAGGRAGGESIREKYADESVAGLKLRLGECKREVIFAILTWHSTPDEVRAMATPEVEFAMIREIAWAEAQGSWMEASHFQRGSLKSFLKSMWSRAFDEPIDLKTYAVRRQSCFGGDHPCPSLATSKDGVHHYCNACGCGDKSIAILDDPQGKGRYTKLMYPKLDCPRQRDGFSNAKLTINGREQ